MSASALSLASVLRRAHRFELGPLVAALEAVGVPLSRIYFDGRPPPRARPAGPASPIRLGPEGRLVQGARRRPGSGEPSVVVYLAAGLFGARSPLPTYFQQLLGEERLADSLGDLLHVLDDSLWRSRVADGHARRGLFPRTQLDPRLTEASLQTTPLCVDWLFRQVFPELRVLVERQEVPRAVRAARVLLGHVMLGQCALDGQTAVSVPALVVTLTAARDDLEGSEALAGSPWTNEVRARLLHEIVPAFRHHPLALRVVLRVLASGAQARVEQARVGEAQVVRSSPPFELTLFSGMLGAR